MNKTLDIAHELRGVEGKVMKEVHGVKQQEYPQCFVDIDLTILAFRHRARDVKMITDKYNNKEDNLIWKIIRKIECIISKSFTHLIIRQFAMELPVEAFTKKVNSQVAEAALVFTID